MSRLGMSSCSVQTDRQTDGGGGGDTLTHQLIP